MSPTSNQYLLKKIILILISVFVLWATYYYFTNIYGWMEFRRNTDTPKRFLNKTEVKKEDYTKDSLQLAATLKELLLQHKGFFYSKEYFEGTEIIIDTILHSPDLNKLAVLVITKNPTSRQLMPNKDNVWYYDGTSYLGVRQNDTIRLSWVRSTYSNSSDQQELSNYVREVFFRTYVSKDTTEKYSHKYNFNDVRFWTSSEWQLIEEDL